MIFLNGCTYHRVDTPSMVTLLAQLGTCPSGTLLRLAWQAGLNRQEICQLTWQQIDWQMGCLQLPHRTAPLPLDVSTYLERWHPLCPSDHVLPGVNGAMAPPSVSRLAQKAMEHLSPVRLADLRHHYILSQLTHRSWASLCHEMAMDEVALRKAYAPHLKTPPPSDDGLVNQATLRRSLIEQAGTLGALAVVLAWEKKYSPSQLRRLQWSDPLLQTEALSPWVTPLTPTQPLVFPMDGAALSRLARQTLITAGLGGVTLQQLANLPDATTAATVETFVKEHQGVDCRQVMTLLSLEKPPAHRLLQTLCHQTILVQVGRYYYHSQQVPPLEQHQLLLMDLFAHRATIYPDDLQRILHIRHNQCQRMLQTMVQQNTLIRAGSGYRLAGSL